MGRLMFGRKKPGVAFWATVGLVAVVLYVASFGPARAAYVHRLVPEWTYRPMRWFHLPIIWAISRLPNELAGPFRSYTDKWCAWCEPSQQQ